MCSLLYLRKEVPARGVEINVAITRKSKLAFDLGELVRQTDSEHTSNVSYLYYLNRMKEKITNKMNGNYTEMNHPVQ